MENEIWLPVKDFEGYYEISSKGRVRTCAIFIRHDGNFSEEGGYVKPHHRIRSTSINRYGYVQIKLCKLAKCRTLTVHRLVAKAFIPNPNKYVQVNHKDGVKTNNSVDNLEWISSSGNIKHAYDTGLIVAVKGENHHKAKLTLQKVADIKILLETNSIKSIAKQFNVSPTTIADIKHKRTWV